LNDEHAGSDEENSAEKAVEEHDSLVDLRFHEITWNPIFKLQFMVWEVEGSGRTTIIRKFGVFRSALRIGSIQDDLKTSQRNLQ
jgi:hypothetical protein